MGWEEKSIYAEGQPNPYKCRLFLVMVVQIEIETRRDGEERRFLSDYVYLRTQEGHACGEREAAVTYSHEGGYHGRSHGATQGPASKNHYYDRLRKEFWTARRSPRSSP